MSDYMGLLQGYGLTPAAAAGIIGNGMMESNMDPTIIQGGGSANEVPVNGTNGYGLFNGQMKVDNKAWRILPSL